MVIIIGLIMAGITTWIAHVKGRSKVAWCILGFLFGLIALLIVAVLPNLNVQHAKEEATEQENRLLREQLRQERLKGEAFRRHATARLDLHDGHLGVDTRAATQLPVPLAADQGYLEYKPNRSDDSADAGDIDGGLVKKWYYTMSGEAIGPLSTVELIELIKNRTIVSDTLLWNPDMHDWKQAHQTEEARGYIHRYG